MANVHVQKQSDTYLRLIKEPSFFFKAVTIGFLLCAVCINVFGPETPVIKILIGLATVCLSYLLIGKFEIWELDKVKSELRYTRLTWCHYLLKQFGFKCKPPRVRAKFEDLYVEEKDVSSSGKAYRIVAHELGVELEVEEVAASGNSSQHRASARSIHSFLGDFLATKGNSEADNQDGELSVSEDDFEQISETELQELKESEEFKQSQCSVHTSNNRTSENDAEAAHDDEVAS